MAAAAATTPCIRTYSRILIASADSSFRRLLISDPVYGRAHSEEAVGGAHALVKLAQFSCDGVLLDRNLPDLDAAEVAELIRQKYPRIEVEFVDSKTDRGAVERRDSMRDSGGNDEAELAREIGSLESKPRPKERGFTEALPGMIGSSPAMENVYRLVRMVAPRETTVLITGETGTGKELVAQAVYKLSSRAKQPFVVVNCAAIPESLFEAELFGYARGAFTGAVQSRLGRVHMAQGGTLFWMRWANCRSACKRSSCDFCSTEKCRGLAALMCIAWTPALSARRICLCKTTCGESCFARICITGWRSFLLLCPVCESAPRTSVR